MIMDWLPIDLVWRGALAVIPLAVVVAVIGRLVPCQPSTRHAMWLIVLALLVVTPFLPRLDFGQLSAGPSADLVPRPADRIGSPPGVGGTRPHCLPRAAGCCLFKDAGRHWQLACQCVAQ